MDSPEPNEEEIFERAWEIEDDKERREYVIQACGDNEKLRKRIERLLSSSGKFGEYFSTETVSEDDLSAAVMNELYTGRTIDRYELHEQIGEGGFGKVYRATQKEPVQREVALKLIKRGMDTDAVLGRFQGERQALAMMEHPNIAQAIDAGATAAGRPYFVMELVRGVPITEFCDKHKLNLEQRLRLFAEVCSAIQHAHQKGIIHRDIKPSNVLVSMQDDKPLPKVIDFGIAKATDESSTSKGYTSINQFIGSPTYMSPEQATGKSMDVDTRSDIYSLGVLLYELLTGTTPFDTRELKELGIDEIRRKIREDDPPRPSARLDTLNKTAQQSVSESRKQTVASAPSRLRGDLDWIVMKALEKDRDRRYETANGLANDIRRYLDYEPVSACKPSAVYLIGKFARRNRGAIVAAIAVLLSLTVGLIGMSILYLQSERNRESAEQQEELAIGNAELAREAAAGEKTQREVAEAAAREAARVAEERRRLQYASDLKSAFIDWARLSGRAVTAAETLARWVPLPGEEDLRDFAWRQHWATVHLTAETVVFDPEVRAAAVSPQELLITVDSRLRVRHWAPSQDKPIKQYPLAGAARNNDHVAISPDGASIVTIGNRQVQVFDSDTGQLRWQHQGSPESGRVLFSADSKTLAVTTASNDRLMSWGLDDGVSQPTLTNSTDEIGPLALDPRTRGFYGSQDAMKQNIHLRGTNGTTSEIRHPHTQPIISLASSPNGRWLASADDTGHINISDRNGRTQKVKWKTPSIGITCLRFSPDGNSLVAGTKNGSITTYHWPTRQVTAHWKGHTAPIQTLRFSNDGKRLTSTGADGTARLWVYYSANIESRQVRPQGFGVKVKSTGTGRSFHFNGTAKLAGINITSSDRLNPGERIHAMRSRPNAPWDELEHLSTRTLTRRLGVPRTRPTELQIGSPDDGSLRTVSLHSSISDYVSFPVGELAVSPDSRWMVSRNEDRLMLRDLSREQPSITLPFRGRAFAFSPDGRYVVGHDVNRQVVTRWDLQQRRDMHDNAWRIRESEAAAISSDETHFAISRDGNGSNWDVEIRNLKNGQQLCWQNGVGKVSQLGFTPDDRQLVALNDRGLWIRSLENWNQPPEHLPTPKPLNAFALSSDGKYIVAGGQSGNVYLWNLQTRQLLHSVTGHNLDVTAVTFAPDGSIFASAGNDHAVHLWHATSGRLIGALRGPRTSYRGLAFKPDGTALVLGADKGDLIIWEPPTLAEIDRHPLMIESLIQLAQKHLQQGATENGKYLLQRAFEQRREFLGPDHELTKVVQQLLNR